MAHENERSSVIAMLAMMRDAKKRDCVGCLATIAPGFEAI
jgi:hypothetical protein